VSLGRGLRAVLFLVPVVLGLALLWGLQRRTDSEKFVGAAAFVQFSATHEEPQC
jgi:hypothetical protein